MTTQALSSDLRYSLTLTAKHLRNGDELAAASHMQTIQRDFSEVANRIYAHLAKEMYCQNIQNFGYNAFWNTGGYSAARITKLKAVEEVHAALVDEQPTSALVKPHLLPTDKEVTLDAFFDCGFDPRFSREGTYLMAQPKKTLAQKLAYITFVLRAYFSPNAEERAIRKLILSCAKTGKIWSQRTQQICTGDFTIKKSYTIDDLYSLEHAFFNKTSVLHKQIDSKMRSQHQNPRLYPSELLHPIHCINKPQSANRNGKEQAKPGWENMDLIRSPFFARFNVDSFNQDSYDPMYVPHYLFIQAVEKPSAKLKEAIRDYRETLSMMVINPLCAQDLAACQKTLRPILMNLMAAWKIYVTSHEILQEAQATFESEDHYKDYHLYQMRQMEKLDDTQSRENIESMQLRLASKLESSKNRKKRGTHSWRNSVLKTRPSLNATFFIKNPHHVTG